MNKLQVSLYLLLIIVLAKETIVCFQLSSPPSRTTIRLLLSTKSSKPLTTTQSLSQLKITKSTHDLTVTENNYNNDETDQINKYKNKDTNAIITFIISTVTFLTTFPTSSTAMMVSLSEIMTDSSTKSSAAATATISTTSTTMLSDASTNFSYENLISLAKEGGKWFFVIYIVVSLIAGAFEMSKRFITWVESNSAKKEMDE